MFQFCRSCGLDFDDVEVEAELPESEPPPGWQSPAKRRPLGRFFAVGIVALVGLGVIGNLAGRPTEVQPASAPQSSVGVVTTTAPRTTVTPTDLALLGQAPNGPTVEATVVRVIDGDTIVVEFGGSQYHLRYIGMDTPESVKPGSPVEPFALAASAANKALVDGKSVVLEKDVSEVDQFDRLLRDVWVRVDGKLVLVGLELVRTGYAQVTTYPPDVRYVDVLLAAQATARTAAIGLWSAPAAATPAPLVATPKPSKAPTRPVPLVGPSKCHPSYSNCLPIVADLDCPDVKAMGKAPVIIKGPDVYRLDRDGDGLGCE